MFQFNLSLLCSQTGGVAIVQRFASVRHHLSSRRLHVIPIGSVAANIKEIRGTVLLTQFHFAIYSLYDSVTDTCQP